MARKRRYSRAEKRSFKAGLKAAQRRRRRRYSR
jgi:hypothetical protein